ncbi:T9SS type A sorting domain-containing protein [uncultured Algibacter sp.]|uniref:T9SS type A sorting domain-containing protein n=1 Tax=uncultured Algibacter sp. TaxID=298659 RepID=UPI0032168284
MKIIVSISFFVLGLFSAFSQINNVTEQFLLPSSLKESSGVIVFNNKLITHNDSGGENKLYEIDMMTEQITRIITISNAVNVDWEDITQDDTSIYVGDIGNNNGNRTDLKIYKINKTDYINRTNVTAETIAFEYADQTNTISNPNNTIWDAEALVSIDANNLILFTKNWVDGVTKAYTIPKTSNLLDPYSVNPQLTTLNSGGLITGGTYNNATGKLYLVGYNNVLQPFVWASEDFNTDTIFSGTNTQTVLSSLAQEQVEAIAFVDENSYLVTSESFSISVGPITVSDDAKLISFSTNDDLLSITSFANENAIVLYPNPVNHILKVEGSEIVFIEIFDTKLTKIYSGNAKSIDVSAFTEGIYIVKIHLKSNRVRVKKFIKK